VYVGQMARLFTKRFKGHHDTFRAKSGLSKFADNMSDKRSSFVPIESIMSVMVSIQKAWHMDVVRNSICKATKISKTFTQLNNQYTVVHKPVFGIITKSAERLAPEHSIKSWQLNVSRDPATSAGTYIELGSRFISSGTPSC